MINAGANTLAQALFDYRATHTSAEVAAFLAKFRVFENCGQDEAGAWIMSEFPDIHWIRSVEQTPAYGGPSNQQLGPHVWAPHPYSPVGQDAWADEHVRENHGALGARYPSRTVAGHTHFIEGGGTVPWLTFVAPGLTDPSEPSWGGWSGRYTAQKIANVPSRYAVVRADELPFIPYSCYTDAEGVEEVWVDPASSRTYDGVAAAVFRWRQAMWNDFRARMDWSVRSYADANHHPHAIVDGDDSTAVLRMTAQPGATVLLDGSDSRDPDGDGLTMRWWHYTEAGESTYGRAVSVEGGAVAGQARVRVPTDAAGTELHLILEVTDRDSEVPLNAYRRVVIRVSSEPRKL